METPVTIYNDINGTGKSKKLYACFYNYKKLKEYGYGYGKLKSFTINNGYKMIVYMEDNFQGYAPVYTAGTYTIGNYWWNSINCIKSIRIFKANTNYYDSINPAVCPDSTSENFENKSYSLNNYIFALLLIGFICMCVKKN